LSRFISLCLRTVRSAMSAHVCTSTSRSSDGKCSYIISEKQAAPLKGVLPLSLSIIFMFFNKLHARHMMTSFSSLNSARESVQLEIKKLFASSFLAVCFVLVISLQFVVRYSSYMLSDTVAICCQVR
jgi:hypothetical protein